MLRLNIVTPERPFLDQECLNVTVPGKLGEMQVLPGHAAILAELAAGVMTIEKPGKESVRFMIGEGYIEVNEDQVNVLCEQARYKSEIDKSQEENLLINLKEQIKKHDESDVELKHLTLELNRCLAKLSLFE